MKKIGIVIAVLVILGGIGVGMFYRSSPGRDWTRVVPAGSLVVVHGRGLFQEGQFIADSSLGQSLKSLDWKELPAKLGATEREQAVFHERWKTMEKVWQSPFWKELLSGESVLAVYAPQSAPWTSGDFSGFKEAFLMAFQVSPQVKAASLFQSLWVSEGSGVEMSPESYNGETIQKIRVEGREAGAYWMKGPWLFVGLNAAAVQNAIDVWKKKKPPLVEDEFFQEAQSDFQLPSSLDVFINIQTMPRILNAPIKETVQEMLGTEVSQEDVAAAQEIMAMIEKRFSGIMTWTLTQSREENLYSWVSRLHFHRSELSDEMKAFYECQGQANTTVRFIPRDVLLYSWNGCMNWQATWGSIVQEMEAAAESSPESESAQVVIQELEGRLGMSLEKEILPALGSVWGVVLVDVRIGGAFPIPKVMYFLQMKDVSVGERLIQKVVGLQPFLKLSEETYRETPIHFMMIPMVSDLSPGYVFLDAYFLLSFQKDLLRKALDLQAGEGEDLTRNPLFRQVVPRFEEELNGVVFVDGSSLSGVLQKLVDWSSQWRKAQRVRVEAFLSGTKKRIEDKEAEKADLEKQLAALAEQREQAEEEKIQTALISSEEKRLASLEKFLAKAEEDKSVEEISPERAKTIAQWKAERTQLLEKQQKASSTEERLESVVAQITQAQTALTDVETVLVDLRSKLTIYSRQVEQARVQDVFLTELIQPLLKAMGTVKGLGADFKVSESEAVVSGRVLIE